MRGRISIFFAKMSNKVYSFEPSKTISENAYQNIALNDYKNIMWNVCGIGEKEEVLTFHDYELKYSGHSSFIEQALENVNMYDTYLIIIEGLDMEKIH